MRRSVSTLQGRTKALAAMRHSRCRVSIKSKILTVIGNRLTPNSEQRSTTAHGFATPDLNFYPSLQLILIRSLRCAQRVCGRHWCGRKNGDHVRS